MTNTTDFFQLGDRIVTRSGQTGTVIGIDGRTIIWRADHNRSEWRDYPGQLNHIEQP